MIFFSLQGQVAFNKINFSLAFFFKEGAHLAQLLTNLNLPIIFDVIVLEIQAMLLAVREFQMQRLQERGWVFIWISTLIEEALLAIELKLLPFGNYVILIVCHTPNILDF